MAQLLPRGAVKPCQRAEEPDDLAGEVPHHARVHLMPQVLLAATEQGAGRSNRIVSAGAAEHPLGPVPANASKASGRDMGFSNKPFDNFCLS